MTLVVGPGPLDATVAKQFVTLKAVSWKPTPNFTLFKHTDMRLHSLSYILCCFSAVLAAYTDVILKSPTDRAVYPAVNGSSVSVTLTYDVIIDAYTERTAFCFHLTNVGEQKRYSENCFRIQTREITINEVSVGEYVLTSFLRELDPSTQSAQAMIAETIRTRNFAVKEYENVIPLLHIDVDKCEETGRARKVAFPVDPKTMTAVADVRFFLTAREIPSDLFRVCLSLALSGGVVVVKEMCLPPGELSARVSNLPIGNYQLQAGLRQTENAETIPSSGLTAVLEVYDLRRAVTSVSVAEHSGLVQGPESAPHMEYVLDKHLQEASAPFAVVLQTSPCSAERLVSVCLELHSQTSGGSIVLPRTCLAPSTRTLTPQRLPAGSFTAFLSLSDGRLHSTDPDAALSLRHQSADAVHALRVLIETRPQEELVPTYEWQRLHAWHTIPAGMDVRYGLASCVATKCIVIKLGSRMFSTGFPSAARATRRRASPSRGGCRPSCPGAAKAPPSCAWISLATPLSETSGLSYAL